MMNKLVKILMFLIAVILLVAGCSGGGASGGGDYIVAAEYVITPDGTHTGLVTIMTSSFNFESNADVYINSVQLPYTFFAYGDSDFLSPLPSPGDTIAFDISVSGSSLVNDSLALPAGGAPASLTNSGTSVASPITISWSAVSPAPQNIRGSLSSLDTVSDEGYDVELTGNATSHVIPANTIEYDSMFPDVTITVSSMNSKLTGTTKVIVTEAQSAIDITTTN